MSWLLAYRNHEIKNRICSMFQVVFAFGFFLGRFIYLLNYRLLLMCLYRGNSIEVYIQFFPYKFSSILMSKKTIFKLPGNMTNSKKVQLPSQSRTTIYLQTGQPSKNVEVINRKNSMEIQEEKDELQLTDYKIKTPLIKTCCKKSISIEKPNTGSGGEENEAKSLKSSKNIKFNLNNQDVYEYERQEKENRVQKRLKMNKLKQNNHEVQRIHISEDGQCCQIF